MRPSRLTVKKRFTFEAAHHLPNHKGKCRTVHGHSYVLYVVLRDSDAYESFSKRKNYIEQGFLIDFSDLKFLVKELIIDKFDHKDLNDFFPIPSAEEVARYCFITISEAMLSNSKFDLVILEKVILYETEDSCVEWSL